MENSELENLKKLEKIKESSWGGKRNGSGRRPLLNQKDLEKVQELVSQHSAEVDETDLEKRERVLVLLEKLYEEGKKGNVQAIKEYLDRQMGKSKESIDLTSKGKQIAMPVLVKFMEEDEKETKDNRNTAGIQTTV